MESEEDRYPAVKVPGSSANGLRLYSIGNEIVWSIKKIR
jgi:hypothetical protein